VEIFLKRLKNAVVVMWPALALLLAELILFQRNFVSGTWLVGWDSTMPEFNLSGHFARNLGAVWQEYRGAGLLDGMAHAANLVHLGYIAFLSIFLSSNAIRYVFIFAMHLLGGLGVYFLVSGLLDKRTSGSPKQLTALFASVFYLLNPATIQIFYAPLELFAIHFAFLPWLILALKNYLRSGRRRPLFIFAAVSLLGVSQAHVPTIFIVYLLAVGVFLIQFLLNRRLPKRRVLGVVFVIAAINFFWAAPYLYSSAQNALSITQSKINRLSNAEILLRNDAFGDFKSVALLRSFNLDFEDWDRNSDTFELQFAPWADHLFSDETEFAGWTFFILAIMGLVAALITRSKDIYPFVALFLISLVGLGSGIPVISVLNKALREFVPLYEEVFRFAFTKFGVLFAFSYSILIAFGFYTLIRLVRFKAFLYMFFLVFAGGIFWLAKPAYQGNFLYDKLRLAIPQEYFDVFEFFDGTENHGRVAILPQPAFWGWEFNSWGYRGSGFVWQGIMNPTLHRAFDPWSVHNEAYYSELSNAIYQRDLKQFSSILNKYDVAYVLVDESITLPGNDQLVDASQPVQMLDNIGATKILAKGALSIYGFDKNNDKFISASERVELLRSNTTLTRQDSQYLKNSDYVSGLGAGALYPFSDIKKEIFSYGAPDKLELDGEKIKGMQALILPGIDSKIELPASAVLDGDKVVIDFGQLVTVRDEGGNKLTRDVSPRLEIDIGESLETAVVYINGTDISKRSVEIIPDEPLGVDLFDTASDAGLGLAADFLQREVTKCWERSGRIGHVEAGVSDGILNIRTRDAVGCSTFRLGAPSAKTLITVSLPYRSDTGARPHFCVVEAGKSECLHDDVFSVTGTSREWTTVDRSTVLDAGKEYWLTIAGRPPDEPGAEWEISYGEPVVKSRRLVRSVEFPATIWKDLVREKKIDLGRVIGDIVLEIPGQAYPVNFASQGRRNARNCDIFERGSAGKNVFETTISYTARDRSSSCDFAIPAGVSTDKEYLLNFVGENKSGRSLKFFLFNQATERNDIEELLPEGEFSSSYAVLDWQNFDPSAYVLNLETKSFGPELAENRLDSVSFRWAPLSWLSRIRLEPPGGAGAITNNLNILSSTKTGTTIYKVKVEGEGVLALSQGYGPGWIALQIQNSKFKIQSLPHLRLNSWANAWMIADDQLPMTNDQSSVINHQSSIIYIFYWPQLLQWAGFIILIGTFAVLLKPGKKRL